MNNAVVNIAATSSSKRQTARKPPSHSITCCDRNYTADDMFCSQCGRNLCRHPKVITVRLSPNLHATIAAAADETLQPVYDRVRRVESTRTASMNFFVIQAIQEKIQRDFPHLLT